MKSIMIGAIALSAAFMPLGAQNLAVSPFTQPLNIPPLLKAEDPLEDRASFRLEASEGRTSFFLGTETDTLGYNGSYLGPTIRVRRGQEVSIAVKNSLGDVTTVHWHGLHVPAEMDGGPHQGIAPGDEWHPEFTIRQEAATLWYHPHPIGKTGEQVYRGLAGLFIIDDDYSDDLDIPKDYGVDDIPLILQDRGFTPNGSFAYVSGMPDIMHGVAGDWILTNGTIQPYLELSTAIARFRILNGSNSSIYRLKLSNGTDFLQIGSDGGFLEAPVSMKSLILAAGERAEIIVDFSNSKSSQPIYLEADEYRGRSFQVMEIRTKTKAGNPSNLPAPVPDEFRSIVRISADQATAVRRFQMTTMGMGGQLAINGRRMDMARIDERIPLGSTEIWEITNVRMGMMQIPHSFHVHDVQFQILSRDGDLPPANELGWKDTILVWPGETVRIIARFEDHTGIYMYHCHFLEHEDFGMMGQFLVY